MDLFSTLKVIKLQQCSYNFAAVVCLVLSFCDSVSAQGNLELDTLSQLTDEVEIIEYTLKIEDFLPIEKRDSILIVATDLARKNKKLLLLSKTLNAQGLIHWSREEFEPFKEKLEEAYEISVQIDDKERIVNTLNNLANYYQRKHQFLKADSIFQECIPFWLEIGDIKGVSKGYNNRSVVFLRQGNYQKSDSLVQIAKFYADSAQDRRVLASALTTEMVMSSWQGNDKKAYKIISEIVDTIAPIAGQYQTFYANTLLNASAAATSLLKYNEAMELMIKADSMYQVLANVAGQIAILQGMSDINAELGDYITAKRYLVKSLDLCKEQEDSIGQADRYLTLAGLGLGEFDMDYDTRLSYADSAFQIYLMFDVPIGLVNYHRLKADLEDVEYKSPKAIEHIDKAIELSEKNKYEIQLNECYLQKAEMLVERREFRNAASYLKLVDEESLQTDEDEIAYKYLVGHTSMHLGDYKTAAFLLDQSFIANDSLASTIQAAKVKEVGTRYLTEKQEAISAKLQMEKEVKELTISRQKSILGFGGLGLSLVSLLSFLLFRQGRKRALLNKDLQKQRNQVVLLNQELNHRVKNNLAFMTSLLEMQSRRTENEETKQALQESETRLKALSLVHSNLFKTESETKINLKEYLTEITDHLKDIFELPTKELVVRRSFVDNVMDAEKAMRIGLIVNELVTNSMKHAFAQVDDPTITIETLDHEGRLLLRYKDNGPGIKEEVLQSDTRQISLGRRLISLLQRQLEDVLVLELV